MNRLTIFLLAGVLAIQVYTQTTTLKYDQLSRQEIRLAYALGPDPRIKHLPPTKSVIMVSTGLSALGLEVTEVRTSTAVIQMRVWREQIWYDPTLTWNPADYGGVNTTALPVRSIWRPDIISHLDLAPGENVGWSDQTLCNVGYDGRVQYFTNALETVRCNKAAEADTYNCRIRLGSFIYNSQQMDLNFVQNIPAIATFSFVPSDFTITNNAAGREVDEYLCCIGQGYVLNGYNFTVAPNPNRATGKK